MDTAFNYDTDKAWYIIHTKIGYEEFVKRSLEKMLETRKLSETVFEMFIPYEDDEKKKSIYPGYLFIYAIMEPETWYIIRNSKYVFGFIGSSGKHARPIPVKEEEIAELKVRCGLHNNDGVEFAEGDKVKILSGPFSDTEGTIKSLKGDVIVVDIEFFNKVTSVEIDKNNLEKV